MARQQGGKQQPAQGPGGTAEWNSQSLEFWLTIEFRNLVPPNRRPAGMYVMPSFDSMLRWYGVIFVGQGYYRKGVFKFVIDMPRNYPNQRPVVTFLTPVFHPYVKSNRQLELSLAFPQWVPKKHFIIHVLQFIKKMFYKIDVVPDAISDNTGAAPNPEALELYRKDTIKFYHECQKCVADCENYKYSKYPRGCSIRFLPFEDREEDYLEMLDNMRKLRAEADARKEASTDKVIKPDVNYTRHVAWFVDKVRTAFSPWPSPQAKAEAKALSQE